MSSATGGFPDIVPMSINPALTPIKNRKSPANPYMNPNDILLFSLLLRENTKMFITLEYHISGKKAATLSLKASGTILANVSSADIPDAELTSGSPLKLCDGLNTSMSMTDITAPAGTIATNQSCPSQMTCCLFLSKLFPEIAPG